MKGKQDLCAIQSTPCIKIREESSRWTRGMYDDCVEKVQGGEQRKAKISLFVFLSAERKRERKGGYLRFFCYPKKIEN